jgi:hypothetical protein
MEIVVGLEGRFKDIEELRVVLSIVPVVSELARKSMSLAVHNDDLCLIDSQRHQGDTCGYSWQVTTMFAGNVQRQWWASQAAPVSMPRAVQK